MMYYIIFYYKVWKNIINVFIKYVFDKRVKFFVIVFVYYNNFIRFIYKFIYVVVIIFYNIFRRSFNLVIKIINIFMDFFCV